MDSIASAEEIQDVAWNGLTHSVDGVIDEEETEVIREGLTGGMKAFWEPA